MESEIIVVRGELNKDLTLLGFSKHDQMVDALPPDRADQSFGKAVLSRRTGRDRLVANAHGAQAAGDDSTVGAVTAADQERGASLQGKASLIFCAIQYAVGCAVTLTQTSSRRDKRTMTRT